MITEGQGMLLSLKVSRPLRGVRRFFNVPSVICSNCKIYSKKINNNHIFEILINPIKF